MLPDLATSADLTARRVDVTDAVLVGRLLAAASASVRRAAGGHPISSAVSTITVTGPRGRWLRLPSGPVTDVTAILVDGVALSGWRWYPDGRVLHPCGSWAGRAYAPALVTVTYAHGETEVPADVVDLVCGLVAGGLAAAAGGYDPMIGVQSVTVDDASEARTTGADARGGAMELPQSTQDWLARDYGLAVAVVGVEE